MPTTYVVTDCRYCSGELETPRDLTNIDHLLEHERVGAYTPAVPPTWSTPAAGHVHRIGNPTRCRDCDVPLATWFSQSGVNRPPSSYVSLPDLIADCPASMTTGFHIPGNHQMCRVCDAMVDLPPYVGSDDDDDPAEWTDEQTAFYGIHDCDATGSCGCQFGWDCDCAACELRFAVAVVTDGVTQTLRGGLITAATLARVTVDAAARRTFNRARRALRRAS